MEIEQPAPQLRRVAMNERVVAFLLREGLLKEPVHFRSGHHLQDEYNEIESIVVEFAFAGDKKEHFYFRFDSNGEIILWACPSPLSDYRTEKILSGTFPDPPFDPIVMLENSINLIRDTFKLYNSKLLAKNNNELLSAWSHLNITSFGYEPEAERKAQDNQRPWWRLWWPVSGTDRRRNDPNGH